MTTIFWSNFDDYICCNRKVFRDYFGLLGEVKCWFLETDFLNSHAMTDLLSVFSNDGGSGVFITIFWTTLWRSKSFVKIKRKSNNSAKVSVLMQKKKHLKARVQICLEGHVWHLWQTIFWNSPATDCSPFPL